MPKKMEDRTPLTAYWTPIRSKNPALAAYKPDITGPIKTYDAGMLTYVKLMQERDKLKDMLVGYVKYSSDVATKITQLTEQMDKIYEKDSATVIKSNNDLTAAAADIDADPAKVTATLVDLCTSADDWVTSRKQIWEQISKMGESKVQIAKKLRDDYKAKATAIATGMKKAEDDAIKLEAQIRSIISAYQKLAIQAKNTDLADAVRSLLDRF